MRAAGVRVVVLDDGSIGRAAAERLVAYAGADVTVAGRHPARLVAALEAVGLPAHAVTLDDDPDAVRWPRIAVQAGVVVVGPPFDAEEFVASLAGWAGEGGGSLVHVLAPRTTQPVRVLPAVPDAAGWVPLVAGVLRDGWASGWTRGPEPSRRFSRRPTPMSCSSRRAWRHRSRPQPAARARRPPGGRRSRRPT